MSYKSRPIKFTYYRLFFVVLLFSVGLICLAQLLIESIYGVSLITPELQSDHDAILVGTVICGLLSMMFGVIMLRLLIDRRMQNNDRRRRQVPIDFQDRRSGQDRRAEREPADMVAS